MIQAPIQRVGIQRIPLDGLRGRYVVTDKPSAAHVVEAVFRELPSHEQAVLLSLLAHQLTVAARAVYSSEVPADASAARLMAFNEMQHQVSSAIRQTLT